MKLMDQVRQILRVRHYSLATERCYCHWILRFIRFHGVKHPNTMGAQEVEHFLTHLATNDKVAASTQNQALNAIVFLYRDVLRMDLGLHARHAKSGLARPFASRCGRRLKTQAQLAKNIPNSRGGSQRPGLGIPIRSRPTRTFGKIGQVRKTPASHARNRSLY